MGLYPTKDEDVPPLKIRVLQTDANDQPMTHDGQPIVVEQGNPNAKNIRWLFGFLALIEQSASMSSCRDSSTRRWSRTTLMTPLVTSAISSAASTTSDQQCLTRR
mmetsp:Transcript_15703/g.37483  ORF Transcript_15703/g.37483 Transcript_15703/m.37483 type:complete len:105 (-) Transcript_15703:984-1298(-)